MTEKPAVGAEQAIGHVSHYFSRIGVAAVELSGNLRVGDRIHIKGHTTDFTQNVDSIQVEHANVAAAGPGASIGIKVTEHAREGDQVFLVPSSEP
jgi:putative protease